MKYRVISGPYFPVFSLNTGDYGPEITPFFSPSAIYASQRDQFQKFWLLRNFLVY